MTSNQPPSSSPNKSDFRVAIVGGGIGGIICALGLVQRNVQVQVYEKASSITEFGAGVGFEGGAVRAMQICSDAVFEAFSQVSKKPGQGGNKNNNNDEDVFFEFVDGLHSPPRDGFTYPRDGVSSAVHRVEFLAHLMRYMPDGVVNVNKHVDSLVENQSSGDPVTLKFKDGTTSTADIVIGYDGIGSHIRQHINGAHHPSARARYAHSYIYRMSMPMEAAVAALGEYEAKSSTIYMGHGVRVIHTPVTQGTLISTVGVIVHDAEAWPSETKMILPASKQDVQDAVAQFKPAVRALVENVQADSTIERWALFDLADNPPATIARRRVCIAGDAAHASTPHLGAGAGFAAEDAAVLAVLIGDERLRNNKNSTDDKEEKGLEAALQAYQAIRYPRGQWLTKAARLHGEVMTYIAPGIGDNMQLVKEKSNELTNIAWKPDIDKMIQDAKDELTRLLK